MVIFILEIVHNEGRKDQIQDRMKKEKWDSISSHRSYLSVWPHQVAPTASLTLPTALTVFRPVYTKLSSPDSLLRCPRTLPCSMSPRALSASDCSASFSCERQGGGWWMHGGQTQLCHFLAVPLWENDLVSLRLSFLIPKMRIIRLLASKNILSIKWNNRHKNFPGGSEVKLSAWNAGDLGSIPGSGRSPGEGNGNPLQYCLENPMDGGAWWATVHRVTKSRTRLSDLTS